MIHVLCNLYPFNLMDENVFKELFTLSYCLLDALAVYNICANWSPDGHAILSADILFVLGLRTVQSESNLSQILV